MSSDTTVNISGGTYTSNLNGNIVQVVGGILNVTGGTLSTGNETAIYIYPLNQDAYANISGGTLTNVGCCIPTVYNNTGNLSITGGNITNYGTGGNVWNFTS